MTEQGRGAAFFDLDRTIISGSSVFVFGMVAWRHDMIPTSDLLSDLRSAVAFRLRGATDDKADAVKDRVLSAIEGQTTAALRGLGDEIIPRLLSEVRLESQGLIDLHHDAGRDTYIVSASPVEIIEDFAAELRMTGAIGTVAETVDGVYTGRLSEPFCYGQGKAEAISKVAAARGYDLRLSYSYSDSAGDLPMFDLVGHPVAVNPDRRLVRLARSRGWPIVEFSRTRKQVVKRTTAAVGAAGLATATYALGRSHGRTRALR